MFLRLLTSAALLLAIGTACAEGTPMKIYDKQEFATYDAQVKQDINDGIRYKEISQANQDTVLKTLTRMEDRWQRADSEGKLNVNDNIDMANDQEIVTTILHHAASDSRLVCDRETPMGTNVAVNVCRTIAQIKRDQTDGQNTTRQMQEQSQSLQGH